MKYYVASMSYGQDELAHYGVLGMKWGVRRYENPDGTLTEAGKQRYGEQGKYTYTSAATKRMSRRADKYESKARKAEAKGDVDKASRFKTKSESNRAKAERSQELDSRMETYARSVTTGGNILSRLFSNVGTKQYTMLLAATNGQNRDQFGKKSLAELATRVTVMLGGAIGTVPAQWLIRRSYVNNGAINRYMNREADATQRFVDKYKG